MIAQSDAEWQSGEKADDVSDVGDVRVVAGYAAFFIHHDDVVDKVNDRNQSLRREEKPGELERSDQHDAACQSEDRSRGPEHSGAARHVNNAENETGEASGKEDQQQLARTDGFFQCVAEDE